MYPQSLQTHSPAQYIAALASSSAFCSAVFFFPNTFKLVVVDKVLELTANKVLLELDGPVVNAEDIPMIMRKDRSMDTIDTLAILKSNVVCIVLWLNNVL